MRLLVDEDSQSKRLVHLLREAGHDVLTVAEVGLKAHEDAEVFAFAKREERVVLTRRGKELAAVVPIEDLELLERLEDRLDLEDARAALKDVKKKGTVPWDKLKEELGL